jgi:hypothetical protein
MFNSDQVTFFWRPCYHNSEPPVLYAFTLAMYSSTEAVPERVRYYDRSIMLMDRLAAM